MNAIGFTAAMTQVFMLCWGNYHEVHALKAKLKLVVAPFLVWLDSLAFLQQKTFPPPFLFLVELYPLSPWSSTHESPHWKKKHFSTSWLDHPIIGWSSRNEKAGETSEINRWTVNAISAMILSPIFVLKKLIMF